MATTTIHKRGRHVVATAAKFQFESTAARVAFTLAREAGQSFEVAMERAATAEARANFRRGARR